MPSPSSSPATYDSEADRAFLQTRVALFWKVMFVIVLLGSGLGALGAVVNPGIDTLLTLATTAESGFLWWLSARGVRSIRFSRTIESGGLLLNAAIGALLGRYLFAGFARDHQIVDAQALVLADGYISLLQVGGMAMMVAIRAALIPSRPRRTVIITALFGLPMLLVNSLLVPASQGGFVLRSFDSEAWPWLPANMAIMWAFAIVSSAAISWVVYGLRAEVREARRLGQYVLEHKLGEGGMGEVYRARHGMMRRPTAVKLVRPDQAGELNLRRFEREVQLTARLTHPNTITIFDYGRTDDGIFYYAMELLDGATLQRIVSVDGAQPAGRVVRILGMLCGALAEAHAIGLIHRDIKPANIMLCTQGGERDVVKLLDFGLVKEFEVDRAETLTAMTAVVGTPRYMAPEAITSPDRVDVRTDIYALGAVAYYLLAGSDVFDGKSVLAVCGQHLHQEPEPLRARGVDVPAAFDDLVIACLSKDPDLRPQTAAELRRRIEACAVEPWDSTRVRDWWIEHQPEFDEPAESTGEARTIAVDGVHRVA